MKIIKSFTLCLFFFTPFIQANPDLIAIHDFAKNNVLKLELSGNHTDEDDFANIILQWSAAF